MNAAPACRSCGAPLEQTFLDLGEQPLANSYPTAEEVAAGRERRYPLHVRVCGRCLLVQADQVVSPQEIFADYAYFSSYSTSWLAHCAEYARRVGERLGLGRDSLVVEVASNDGYLLANFVAAGIPVLGVDPAENVARAAIAAGVPTEVAFFGRDTAARIVERGRAADLVVANNVLAHVPDLDDFVAGLAAVLKPSGMVTIEVPHLLRMLERTEFDTIYHEHLSYFTLLAASDVLRRRGLRVVDVEELPTHGGSLRIWAVHADDHRPPAPAVGRILAEERGAGLHSLAGYGGFAGRVAEVVDELRSFVAEAAAGGSAVAAYGAAAKGNTLLNAAGLTSAQIPYVADRSPHKQGRLLPGSHVPIVEPAHVGRDRPDYLLLLAWNLRDEIVAQMEHIRGWGGRFVVPVPHVEVLP